MQVLNIRFEEVKYEEKGELIHIERYDVDGRTTMAHHDASIMFNMRTKEVSGDCVRYGSWDDLSAEEVQEYIDLLKAEGALKRSYEGFTIIE
jgi:hypothetical protein